MGLTLNPVLDRELKERVRGRRAVVVLTIYLMLLSFLVYAIYWAETRNQSQAFINPAELSSARTGRLVFDWLVVAALLLTCFIVPGLTAAGVAGERDRQTLIPLQVTLLRPWSIVVGKLLAALSFLLLLLLATMPLMAVALLLGGVTIGMILKAVLMIAASGIVLGSLSLACSSVFRRVQGATVAAYALTVGLLGGTALSYGAVRVFLQRSNPGVQVDYSASRIPLLANPIVGVAVVVVPSGNSTNSPLASVSRSARGADQAFDQFGNPDDSVGDTTTWLKVLGIDAALTAGGLLVASSRLRTPRMVDR